MAYYRSLYTQCISQTLFSESDSDGEMEEFSGMELPPLINSLKRILSEYPDGGQIIKVRINVYL